MSSRSAVDTGRGGHRRQPAADEPLPAGAVLLSPLVDLTASGASIEDRAGDEQ